MKKIMPIALLALGLIVNLHAELTREEIFNFFKLVKTYKVKKLQNILNSKNDAEKKEYLGAYEYSSWKQTPLHIIAGHYSNPLLNEENKGKALEIANFFIANGALLEAQDHRGKTPLLQAAEFGSKKMVELLTQNNANILAQDTFGKTAMDLALKRDDSAKESAAIIVILFRLGALLNIKSLNSDLLFKVANLIRGDAELYEKFVNAYKQSSDI